MRSLRLCDAELIANYAQSLDARDGRYRRVSRYIYIIYIYFLFSSFAYIYIYTIITITIHNFEDTKFTLALINRVPALAVVRGVCMCVFTCVCIYL